MHVALENRKLLASPALLFGVEDVSMKGLVLVIDKQFSSWFGISFVREIFPPGRRELLEMDESFFLLF